MEARGERCLTLGLVELGGTAGRLFGDKGAGDGSGEGVLDLLCGEVKVAEADTAPSAARGGTTEAEDEICSSRTSGEGLRLSAGVEGGREVEDFLGGEVRGGGDAGTTFTVLLYTISRRGFKK